MKNIIIKMDEKEFEKDLNHLMKEIIDTIGCGFQESIYQNALIFGLRNHRFNKYKVENEVNINVMFRTTEVGIVRLDIIVNNEYIIEMKTINIIKSKQEYQLKRYMKLLNKKVGFLINVSDESYEIKKIVL